MSLKEKCQVCFKEVFQKNMKKHMNSHTKNVKAMLDFVHMVKWTVRRNNKLVCFNVSIITK